MNLIKETTGKALEYAKYSVNLHSGCSNDCVYCYLKRGYGGSSTPTLKLSSAELEFFAFKQELFVMKDELVKEGLFFTFSSDPMLHETIQLNMMCAKYAISQGIHVTILTKCAWWNGLNAFKFIVEHKDSFTIGFTLTGVDSLEPGASSNVERIELMKSLHENGVQTFASIEPVINFDRSLDMITKAAPYCNEFRIGLMSGVDTSDYYDVDECHAFISSVKMLQTNHHFKIMWKKSIQDFVRAI